MTNTNHEMEASHIQIKWQMHRENMVYRKERDLRDFEHKQLALFQG